MKQVFSIREVKNRLTKTGLKIVGKYTNCNTKTKFKCICGTIFYTRLGSILYGKTKSCGCVRKRAVIDSCLIDLTGRTFNQIYVHNILPPVIGQDRKYKCVCRCGKTFIASGNHIKSGHTKSCGCYRDKIATERLKRIHKFQKGKNNPNYNPLLTDIDRIPRPYNTRNSKWRIKVFKRDDYTCRVCQKRGGKLVAHHLDGYHWCKEKRFYISNGVTLCEVCHLEFHKIYGNQNNTLQQFQEYSRSKT